MRRKVFLDVETTGLNPDVNEVFEIAYQVLDDGLGDIRSSIVHHSLHHATDDALEVNRYRERGIQPGAVPGGNAFESHLRFLLTDAIVVGANTEFDRTFLAQRWGFAPWYYRSEDVESMALTALDLEEPLGLFGLWQMLTQEFGFLIDEPDHTAAGDVRTTRQVWYALKSTMLMREMNVRRRAKGWDV